MPLRSATFALLMLAGCTREAATPGPTYHGSVRGFLEARCTVCHSAGGTGPFALTSWAEVSAHQAEVVDAVSTRRMPPHAPQPGCRDVMTSAMVPAADVALLERWRDTGFSEGSGSEYKGPEPLGFTVAQPVGEASVVVVDPELYAPPHGPDVFAEVFIDGGFPDDLWVTATELVPSASQVVHHANAFIVTNGEPSTLNPTKLLGAYAPGYASLVMPQGSALFVPKGSSVKFTVHYSTLSIGDGQPVPAGHTSLRLWTLPAGQLPQQRAFLDSLSQSDLLVPALAPHVEVAGDSPLRYPGSVIAGVIPHMHLLGTGFRASLAHADGGAECLVELPDYDFLHQALLQFPPEAYVPVSEGDSHRMTCVYDNSQENQPIVNGLPKTSVDVTWGDNSTDEMCTDAMLRLAPL